MKKYLFILSLLCSTMMCAQINADSVLISKAAGDSAYIKTDYTTAISIYESVLQEGEAAEVYYNLGNSYYKKGEIAKAILNYERALLLDPNNGDLKANLEIARAKTVDKVVPIPEIFFISWFKSLINMQSIDSWAVCGIIFFMILLVSSGFYLFTKSLRIRKIGFYTGCVSLLITILANVFAVQQNNLVSNRNQAIVMTPSVTIRSTPSESGTSLFILHEGHKVEIKDNSMKDWKEIKLEDGKVGWIATSDIEVI